MSVDPTPAYVPSGAVVVPVELAEPLWMAMRAWIRERERDGARLRPGVQELADILRAAVQGRYLAADANGPVSGVSADIATRSAASAGSPVPTEALATRLSVSARHARRVARAEGITPIRRNCWAREDVEALVARRSQT